MTQAIPRMDDQEALLRLIARLYYLDGQSQHQISEMVGLSRPHISRLLARARELGIVQMHVAEYQPYNRELEDALRRRLGLKKAVVVRTLPGATTAQVRQTIGYFAAPIVAEMLRPNLILGTAGGRTLRELVRYLTAIDGIAPLTIVQLMGHIGPTTTAIDALELSHAMARRFGRDHYILNAPAFTATAATRDVFMAHEYVQAVTRLFARMHLAFVGIGTLQESAWIEHNTMTGTDVARLAAAGAQGEICGRFYDSQGIECDTPHRDRVISISLDELRRVPEVIAVTNGPERAAAILAALRGSLIKSLVIDEAGARALMASAQA